MLSSVQQYQQQQQEVQAQQKINNFRLDNKNDGQFYYYGGSQHQNNNNNFEIANRAFYATINKFTKQQNQLVDELSTRRRSPPYSFLENWYLHSIYSKSQQTLLGITPVRPSVLLSGDDFMFTPPFVHPEDEDIEEYEEDDYMDDDILDWDYCQPLMPCPGGHYQENDFNRIHVPITKYVEEEQDAAANEDWITTNENTHHIIDMTTMMDETDSSSTNSSMTTDEEEILSSMDLLNLFDQPALQQKMASSKRVKSRQSSFDDASSSTISSYQSLADIINSKNQARQILVEDEEDAPHHYGTTNPTHNSETTSTNIFYLVFAYIMSLWQILIFYFSGSEERQPLL